MEHPTEPSKDCRLCPRLVAFRDATKTKYPDWFNAPVPSFGPSGGANAVGLLIVGLAPGLQGANRTGRPFTGDWAGDLLFATLLKKGLASGSYDQHIDDGLTLNQTMITNAVRCVPPQNKPIGAEMTACRPFLGATLTKLPNLKVIICLGGIAHQNTLSALELRRADYKFGHQHRADIQINKRCVALIDSYHCSRYNTNTKRLTEAMFEAVFDDALAILNA